MGITVIFYDCSFDNPKNYKIVVFSVAALYQTDVFKMLSLYAVSIYVTITGSFFKLDQCRNNLKFFIY